MFVSRRELARLERELKSALQRATAAEKGLADERQRHDWLILQLTDRIVTKRGGYGLAETKPEPVTPPTPEPTQEDLDVLEFFKTCAAEVGESEQDAIEKWKMHMRGESLLIDDKPEM